MLAIVAGATFYRTLQHSMNARAARVAERFRCRRKRALFGARALPIGHVSITEKGRDRIYQFLTAQQLYRGRGPSGLLLTPGALKPRSTVRFLLPLGDFALVLFKRNEPGLHSARSLPRLRELGLLLRKLSGPSQGGRTMRLKSNNNTTTIQRYTANAKKHQQLKITKREPDRLGSLVSNRTLRIG